MEKIFSVAINIVNYNINFGAAAPAGATTGRMRAATLGCTAVRYVPTDRTDGCNAHRAQTSSLCPH